ncbi:hypothetical protein BDZ89DRAFT_1077443, partial [Hymenopellis radicata]
AVVVDARSAPSSAFGVHPRQEAPRVCTKSPDLCVQRRYGIESDTSSTSCDSAFGPDRPSTPPPSLKCCGQTFGSQAYIKHVHVSHRKEA